MRGATSLPVEHERPAAVELPLFLRASARHPVRRLHPAPRVGSQKRDHHRLRRWHHPGEVSSPVFLTLMPWLFRGAQTDSQGGLLWSFLDSFKCSSHYCGISLVATWMSINEITTFGVCVCDCTFCCLFTIKIVNRKLGFTRELGPTACTPHTHIQMILLPYYYLVLWDVRVRRCICECACYYVELHLILPLVMCLSHRYGRQSTPEHNYLALQKSPYPQGKTERRETVMARAVGREYSYRFCFYNNTEGSRQV